VSVVELVELELRERSMQGKETRVKSVLYQLEREREGKGKGN
jgi:hypothetical protein